MTNPRLTRTINFRLDRALDRAIDDHARSRGVSKADVIREAILKHQPLAPYLKPPHRRAAA